MFLSQPSITKPRWKYMPLGLFILVGINLLAFAFFEYNDIVYRNKANDYYFKSDLDKIEFPIYVRYLQRHLAVNTSYNRFIQITEGMVSNQELYWMQRYDPLFQNCLNTNECLPDNSLYYIKWQERRREYLRLLKKDSAETYAFKSSSPSFTTGFSSLFMNADYVQCAVNLIFLILVGILLESILGFSGILGCYILCGTLTLSAYCLLMPYCSMPILCAAGAIGGLVSLTTFINGSSSLRLHYFNGRHFSDYNVSSHLLLPVWVIIQLGLLMIGSLNTINLLSQTGGLLGGAIIGLTLRRAFFATKRVEPIILNENKRPSLFHKKFNEAVNQISLSNFEAGQQLLNKLLIQYPNNREVYFQLFNLLKSAPQNDDYHKIVFKIFSLKDKSQSTTAMKNQVFKHYQAYARPSMHFDAEIFLSLLQRFREDGYWDDAEKILNILIQKVGGGIYMEEIAQEQLLLAQSYLKKNNKLQCDKILSSMIKLFPDTESAKQARNILP